MADISAPVVLVIDDESFNRRILAASLEKHGFVPRQAENGARSLDILRSEKIDTILLDLLMPEMDGFEVIRIVKSDPTLRDIPIIVTSSLDEMKSIIRCIEMGATDYLTKPIDEVMLLARLNASLADKFFHDREKAYLKDLQQARDRLKAVFAVIPDLIIRIGWDGTYREFFAYLEKDLILPVEALLGKTIREILPSGKADIFYQCLEEARANGRSGTVEYDLDVIGGAQTFELTMITLGEEGALAVIHNITERKKLQYSVQTAQKMAGLSTMAGGVAHEINSPLQVMSGTVEMLKDMIHKNEWDPAYVESKLNLIQRNIERCASITHSLFSYASPFSGEMQPKRLNQIIQDTLELVSSQLAPERITLKLELMAAEPLLVCNQQQVQQALINLLTNARDAIYFQGEIIIRTLMADDHKAILCQVSDNGHGMTADIRSRIFDPFFTTKSVGRGVGLGLANVLATMRAHGGKVTVDSEPHVGTTFTLIFPLEAQQDPDMSVNGRYTG